MKKVRKLTSKQRNSLGLDINITRRDFLNSMLLGTGIALLDLPAPLNLMAETPDWNGPGGVGDYSGAHGNMESVRLAAHKMRDGDYDTIPDDIKETGEILDLVVIGGGISGLGAAWQFSKYARRGKKCLIIDNHSIFGGEAKRNEFDVNGQLLRGPQGSNSFVVLGRPGYHGYDYYSELGIPTRFRYQKIDRELKNLQFDRTNFGFMMWFDAPSVGYYFNKGRYNIKSPEWAKGIWHNKLANAPFPAEVKEDFYAWKKTRKSHYRKNDFFQFLDSMSYKDCLENHMGLRSDVTDYANPILAASLGLGCDAISAYGAYQIGMPGFAKNPLSKELDDSDWQMFPGGNDGFSRHLIKAMIPDAIEGRRSFRNIINGQVNFDALDRPGSKIRMRLNTMAVRVEHEKEPDKSDFVWVTYVKAGRVYRLKAKAVIMSSGSWVGKRVVRDLPVEYKEAFSHFYRSPMLVVNVALTNWRFLHKLGITACRWFEGFGFSCNITQPMVAGDYKPPLHPDKPIVLTFYVPYYFPGLSVQDQGPLGRRTLLKTNYYDFEVMIKEQMLRLFGNAGFDPKRDIAGIILNRWGHAYVTPQPGFYYGRNGKPAPRDIIRKRYGRIAFGHSELNGHQNWVAAIDEGSRAYYQLISVM